MPGRVLDVKGVFKRSIVRSSIKVTVTGSGVLAAVGVHLHDCRMIG